MAIEAAPRHAGDPGLPPPVPGLPPPSSGSFSPKNILKNIFGLQQESVTKLPPGFKPIVLPTSTNPEGIKLMEQILHGPNRLGGAGEGGVENWTWISGREWPIAMAKGGGGGENNGHPLPQVRGRESEAREQGDRARIIGGVRGVSPRQPDSPLPSDQEQSPNPTPTPTPPSPTPPSPTPPQNMQVDFTAGSLPHTNLSEFIEGKIRDLVSTLEPVEGVADTIHVREISCCNQTIQPSDTVRDNFEGVPDEVDYRSRSIMMFQKIDNVDVAIFSMYVQEYEADSSGPPRVYLAYLDSVEHFRPRAIRSNVFHEVRSTPTLNPNRADLAH
jgi:hypothetical protein